MNDPSIKIEFSAIFKNDFKHFFSNLFQDEADDDLNDRLKRIAINQCCALIYTSGTTGSPKVSQYKLLSNPSIALSITFYSTNILHEPGQKSWVVGGRL